MSKKDTDELSEQTKTTHETIREQLRHTGENIDRRVDGLRAKIAARFSTRRRTAEDLPLSALKPAR